MKINNSKIISVFVLITVAVSSCNIYKPYKTPDVKTDDLYRAEVTDSTNMAETPWQDIFTDIYLRSLIDSALTNNFDYRTVMLKVNEANAAFTQSQAAFYPTLNLSAQEDITKIQSMKHTESYAFTGSASWEIDIFGRLRSAKRAAKASLIQSIAYKRAVETQMVSSVATGYYTLLSLDKQLQISLETELLYQQTVRTMEGMFESGTSRAAIEQAKANLYSIRASIEDLRYNIRATENSLRLLIGKPAGMIERGTFDNQKLTPILSIGVPSQLLSNRPDVMQAEAGVRYAFARTNMARAAFYPKFTISATGGYTNGATTGFSPLWFGDFVGGLLQPIFNAGANRANLRIAKAQQEEALLAFQKSLVNAGIEVSNALYNYTTTGIKLVERQKQVASMKQAVDDTNYAFPRAGATYLEVLTAQQGLLSAQLSQVSDQLSQLTNVVNLYHALGGGWERPAEKSKN